MKSLYRFLTAALFVAVLAVTARADGLEKMVRELTLKNGMKVIMVERHASPTVAVWVRFKVGSVNERSDQRGIAHMLEHMLFKGTRTIGTTDYAAEVPIMARIEDAAQALMAEKLKRAKADPRVVKDLSDLLSRLQSEEDRYVVSEEYSRIFAKNGGVNFNAFTAKDTTAYMVNLPANKLELWAAVQADRMLHPVLRQFYTERNVVMEERRRSYDAQPEGKLWESFLATAFQLHPYGQPVIGWPSDIENLSRTKAEEFLHSYYAPNNAVVAIIGDIDPPKVAAMMERYFGDIPPGKPVPPVAAVEPKQTGERRVEVIGDAEPELLIGYHKPALPDPDVYAFEVLESILADGRTSRLYKKLVEEMEIATDVSTGEVPGSLYPNLFIIAATPRAPHTVREVEEAIYKELDRLRTEPVTQHELTKVLNNMEASQIHSMSSNGGLAYWLTEYEATTGNWRYFFEHRQKLAQVTPADILRVVRTYLVRENRTVGFITKREVTK